MSFPGFDQLFRLSNPLATRPYRGQLVERLDWVRLSRGDLDVLPPLTMRHAEGTGKPSDVIWATLTAPLLISQRLRDLFGEHRISGWRTHPVTVLAKDGSRCGDYHYFSVTGRRGPIDLSMSTLTLREMPGGYFPYFHGEFFDPESWDGSDWTMPAEDQRGGVALTRVVTKRVVELFRRNRIRNVRFEPLDTKCVHAAIYESAKSYLLPNDYTHRLASLYKRRSILPPPSYRDRLKGAL